MTQHQTALQIENEIASMPPKADQSKTPRSQREQRVQNARTVLNNVLDSDPESGEEDEGSWVPVVIRKQVVAFRRKADGFECRVGDCLEVMGSDGNNWVGLLRRFVGRDDEGDECAEFVCRIPLCRGMLGV